MPTLQASLRLSFANILFPTDFTEASEAALPYAQAFAQIYGSQIFVTHAVTPPPPVFLPMEPIPLEMDMDWHEDQKRLEQFVNLEALQGTVHKGIIERGELWNVVEDVIRRHSVDLVILGSRGKHGFMKLVLGSGAEQIFRHADCPVLTVGPKVARVAGGAATFRRILFATDFSAGSLHALPYALSLAEEHQASLILLHVIPLVPLPHQALIASDARRKLEALIPPEADDWCRPEAVVRFEFPAEAILAQAKEQKADLIVMGVHKGRPLASAHLPWAIAYEVVCHAVCPVLTVRG